MSATRVLAREDWTSFLDQASEELLNTEVSIDVLFAVGPTRHEARGYALQGLVYDRRDDVLEICAVRGGPHGPTVVRRLIDHPQHVETDGRLAIPTLIAVDGLDGVRTIIRFVPSAAFSG